MLRIRLVGLVTTALLSGCAWVLPKPPPPSPLPTAEAAAYASCTLELTERRKSLSVSIPGAGAAQPLIIGLADALQDDRSVRDGASIIVRRAAGGGAVAHEGDTVQARLELVGARDGAHAAIGDHSRVRLRAPAGDRAKEIGATDKARAESLPEEDLVVIKADTPNPNRPSSCDSLIRDGDFIFLKSTRRNAWVIFADRGLTIQDPSRARTNCRTSQEQCYTDRFGSPVCVNYFTCDDRPER